MNPTKGLQERNLSIDYLRGLAAIGVLCYHMYLFNYGEADASTILAKLKIYAVAIFYVISGLTLTIVYLNKLKFDFNNIMEFYLKRIARIVPLLYLATILQIIINSNIELPSIAKLGTNFTIFYGSFKPSTYIVGGAWSIGNEMLFYLFFPLLIWLIVKNLKYFYIAVLLISIPFFYFTFIGLNIDLPLGAQWNAYATSFNQFLYFVIGIIFGIFRPIFINFQKYLPALIIVFTLAFIYYPISGEPIHLVVGLDRIFLSIIICSICYFFYNCDLSFLPKFIKNLLNFFADCSYSIYLLHMVIFSGLQRFMDGPPWAMICITVSLTFVFSYISYNYFELFFVKKMKQYLHTKKLKISAL